MSVLKGVFAVTAVGAVVLNGLTMVVFIFADFGVGWGLIALAISPVTILLGPPIMWYAYEVPNIALLAWGVMLVSALVVAVLPEGNR